MTFLRLSLLLATLLALPAWGNVTLNLKDADISTLIATVSEVTGRNFIVDPRVKGKVTVISSRPMSADGAYETFLAVLQVQGFAVIPAGEAYKIIPETNARQDGGGPGSSGRGLPTDEVVTHVFSLENVSAAQLVPILRPIVPQWGHLAAYAPSNMLIIVDRAANVQRLDALIRRMDQSGDREIESIRLRYAAASEIVRILTTLSQQDKQSDPSTRPAVIIADERSNSVLIGGDKSERQKFLDIIQTLDIELTDDGATQVIYLRYASAENLAPILEGYAQQISQGERAAGGAAAAGQAAPAGGSATGVRVLADNDTNALIVTAAPKIMRQVRDVIAQLDIQRAQVMVEAVIAEVSANQSSQLGVDWAVFNGERIAAAGILYPTTLQGLTNFALSGGGNPAAAAGLLGQGINVIGGRDGGDGTSFGLLLKALRGDGDTNILSTPTLVTLDNQEASFSAGQEVPFLTGSFSNTGVSNPGGVVNPFQTIERRDVGLTLGVTPQINEGNTIKLKLDLEVSSLASGAAGGANLITNKRTLTNTVAVENGQILVIGGLIDDSLQDTQRSVPVLGAIPVLGALFRFRSVEKIKRNLMVFIRPSILREMSDGDYYTRAKYNAVRQAQIDAVGGRRVPLIGGDPTILEPIERYATDRPPVTSPLPLPPVELLPPPTPAPQR
jgi:general secretion pathway protein D